ncbi:MAG: MerR family transcriptional regulator [Chloroflexi bacterium]|nr:MerR family transcriptional regulator [Chloroflexota bacterium]
MFRIGDFSKLSQVSVKTLRYYDELGLLKPVEVDRFTNYRYYSADQLPRLNRILALKDLGLSLDEIAQLLDDELPAAQIRGMLRLKQVEARERVQDEQARLARVEARLRQIEQEGKMPTYDVVVKRVEPLLVASVRDVIPSYDAQGQLWGELDGFLSRRHAHPVGPCLTLYHDTEFKERDVDVEVCEPLGDELPREGRVNVYTLPGVESMACVLHLGGFANVGQAYSALTSWIQANGYRIIGPNREVYLVAVMYQKTDVEYPADFITDKEENRLTEIQFPVAKV